MTCRELCDLLLEYVAGELPAETGTFIEHHLRLCPNCVEYLRQYRFTIALARRALADHVLQ